MTELYFAYAANMSSATMSRACPEHRCLGPAELRHHRLAFTRRSVRTGTGVADVVDAPGESVWGVLYELNESSLAALDAKEGNGWAYQRTRVGVLQSARSGDGGAASERPREVQALTYLVIDRAPAEVEPSREYVEQILRSGTEHGLPEAYLAALRARLVRLGAKH